MDLRRISVNGKMPHRENLIVFLQDLFRQEFRKITDKEVEIDMPPELIVGKIVFKDETVERFVIAELVRLFERQSGPVQFFAGKSLDRGKGRFPDENIPRQSSREILIRIDDEIDGRIRRTGFHPVREINRKSAEIAGDQDDSVHNIFHPFRISFSKTAI